MNGLALRFRNLTLPQLWLLAGAIIAFSVFSPILAMPLRGMLDVPESVRITFNLLAVTFAPFGLLAVTVASAAMWTCGRYIARPGTRLLAIALIALIAASLPYTYSGFRTGWEVANLTILVMPPIVLSYIAPLGASAIYIARHREDSLARVLGVSTMAFAIGLFTFMMTGVLIGAETD